MKIYSSAGGFFTFFFKVFFQDSIKYCTYPPSICDVDKESFASIFTFTCGGRTSVLLAALNEVHQLIWLWRNQLKKKLVKK